MKINFTHSKLTYLGEMLKKALLFFAFLFVSLLPIEVLAQKRIEWIELREQGANFQDIKKAFYRQYGRKIKESQREFVREMKAQDKARAKGKLLEIEEEDESFEAIAHYMRWAEWVEPRVVESNGNLQAMFEGDFRARLNAQNKLETRGASWSILGPINQTTAMAGNGRVNNLRADPTNTSILYSCTPAGQLWKSVNGGVSWAVLTDGIPTTGVTDLAIDPTATNTLYAVTGDGDQALYHPNSGGVYKSTNGGATWTVTGLSYTQANRVILTSILVNPTNPNILIVGGTNGIWRSTNGGSTFTQVKTGVAIRDLVFKPNDPSVIYAGSKYGGQLFKSTDGGINWTQLVNGLPVVVSGNSAVSPSRYAVDVSPVNPNYVYVLATNGSSNMLGFYRSTDEGATFTLMSATPNIPNGQGWYNLCLATDPTDANIVYAGGLQVNKSVDGGATWTLTSSGVHVDVHDLTFVGSSLYAASDGGVYKSINSASTWTNISSNMGIAQLYGLGLSATNANLIIGGHQDNGTNLTSDLTSWRFVSGGDGMISFIDRTNDNNMFCTYQNGYLRRSTNGGTSFTDIYTVPGGRWVTPFIQDPQVATTLYTGGTNMYKSIDAGTNWTTISTPLQGLIWIDVARTNNQIIYFVADYYDNATNTYTAAAYKSVNGGANWTNVTPPSGFSAPLNVHIDVNNVNNVYLTCASYSGNSVFFSDNGGTTWSNISAGLPNVPTNTVVTQLGLSGAAYCGTDIGVYYRPNSSSGWQSYSAGLPVVPVRDLEIFYPTNKIRAATFGRSIWESPINASSCAVPTNLAANVSNSNAILSWIENSNSTSWEIKYGPSGFNPASSGTSIIATSNPFSLSNLPLSTTYDWYVRAGCSPSGYTAYSVGGSFTTPTTITYCTANYSQVCLNGNTGGSCGVIPVDIKRFFLRKASDNSTVIDNNNSGCLGATSNHTSIVGNVQTGQAYNFTVGFGTGPTGCYYYGYVGIWIDYNSDGDFLDANETAYLGTDATIQTGSFTIPNTVSTGNKRLRVRRSGNPFIVSDPACATFPDGEAEDYTLNVSGGASNTVQLAVKVFLQGPYSTVSSGTSIAGLMNDDLRRNNLIPTAQPYSSITGFTHVGGGGTEITTPSVLAVTGNDAIVDWVFLQLRSDATTVVATRAALIQRDGDIVDVNGVSPVTFNVSPSIPYYVVIRHRNHLGIRSASTVSFSTTPYSIDFTTTSVANSNGLPPQRTLADGKFGLYMGNVIQDSPASLLKYSGLGNDRVPILTRIGGTNISNTATGYFLEDCNMDGVVKYSGLNNDRAPILNNIGGINISATLIEQF